MVITTSSDPSGGNHKIIFDADHSVIDVSFESETDPKDFDSICKNPKFIAWISLYQPRSQQRLKLSAITFKHIQYDAKRQVERIEIQVDGHREPEMFPFSRSIILGGSSCAILVVLRVEPEGYVPPVRTTTNQQDNNTQERSGPRTRDYVIFTKQPRLTIGAPDHRECPSGILDSSGSFVGQAADLLRSQADIEIKDTQLVDMPSIALSRGGSGPRNSLGVALAPDVLDERVKLLLYRETVTTDFYNKLVQSITTRTGLLALDVVPLSDAWRSTSDAKTLSALFLFHELRYYTLMPKYRPPREVKKAPTFTNISAMDPNGSGYNLRVKVVAPPAPIDGAPTGTTRPAFEGVVGDATGTVILRVAESDMVKHDKLLNTVGSNVVLRNVNLDMQSGFITVFPDSRFSKISGPTDDEIGLFKFAANTTNDVSAAEYEVKVVSSPPSATRPRQQQAFRGGRGGGRVM